MEIYRPLLEWNIGKLSISKALVDSFKVSLHAISFLQLLLAKGVDPNKDDAHCFVVATKELVFAKF